MATTTAKPTNTLYWSDGELFNGYVRVQMTFPTGYDQAFIISKTTEQMIPQDYIFPVFDGVIDNSLAVWLTTDISPYGIMYSWSAYDTTFTRIAGPSALFSVTSSSFTLPSLTLAVQTPSPTMPLNTNVYYTFSGGDTYTPDLANGQFHEIYLNRTSTTINTPIYTNGTLVAGQTLNLILFRDNASISTARDVVTATTYLWPNGSKDESGFLVLPSTTNVQNIATFVYQPTGNWLNTSWLVGIPRS